MMDKHLIHRTQLALAVAILALCTGCGGPDLGGAARSNAFDSGLSGNFNNFGTSGGGLSGARPQTSGGRTRGTYPKVEVRFELPDVKGNPFDYTENDVLVTFTTPDGRSVRVPAFFDGGKTWRVRYTPTTSGRHTISNVTLNGTPAQPDKLDRREFDVTGSPQPGFVRRDPKDRTRFVFDNGNNYYPIGHNVGWGDVVSIFEKMGRAGENWARVWMCHWDGKNLDWPSSASSPNSGGPGGASPPGTLSLEVAKKWDEIVEAAEKNGIYFQMVLQHHGQYSSRVNPNWNENPWNRKNGGWLATPDEFFSNPRAIALTRAKYRYILARWGYSPNVLAWELFNEVEWTDAMYHKHADEVAEWHNSMAAFLRQQDPYKHLITSSSTMAEMALWKSMDYYQPHLYIADPQAVGALDTRKLDRPIFYGEVGPSEGLNRDTGRWLHDALWAGVMSEAGGAAQYWAWETVERGDLYSHFRAAMDFVKQSGLLSRRGLLPVAAGVETKERAPLSFGPGLGWAQTKQTEWVVSPSGAVEGLGGMPSFLQGNAHREMFPGATFKVTYAEPGTFTVTVGQVAKAGAHLTIAVDGALAADKEFPAAERDTRVNETLEVKVAAGAHTIRVENTGADWVVIRQFTLAPYVAALGVRGKAGKDYAALWLYNRLNSAPAPGSRTGSENSENPTPVREIGERTPSSGASSGEAGIGGKVMVAGLQPGSYRAVWWDTYAGKPDSEETVEADSGAPLTLTTPAIARDAAVYLTRIGAKAARTTAPPKKDKDKKS